MGGRRERRAGIVKRAEVGKSERSGVSTEGEVGGREGQE